MAGKIKNYEGQVVNGRMVGELSHQNDRGVAIWNWICVEHGTQGTARISSMKKGRPSCCYDRKGKNNPLYKTAWEGLSVRKFNYHKRSAESRGHEFSVNPQYLWELWQEQNGICVYSGRKLGDINSKIASLDRIHSDRGYVTHNVEWVHTDVNMAKQSLTRSQFILLCAEIAHHRPSIEVKEEGQQIDDPAGDRIIRLYMEEPELVEVREIDEENRTVTLFIPWEATYTQNPDA